MNHPWTAPRWFPGIEIEKGIFSKRRETIGSYKHRKKYKSKKNSKKV